MTAGADGAAVEPDVRASRYSYRHKKKDGHVCEKVVYVKKTVISCVPYTYQHETPAPPSIYISLSHRIIAADRELTFTAGAELVRADALGTLSK